MPTTGTTNISKQARNITSSPKLAEYDLVRIIAGVDDDGNQLVYESSPYTAGDNVLEFENPFGTQAMANSVYNIISGYEYQPLTADGANLDTGAARCNRSSRF